MKILSLAFLATTAMVLPALANEFRPVSKIDAVTVFPTGADVTRVAELNLTPGDHQLIIENLPGDIDTKSIRVAGEGGEGIEIASVDSKVSPLANEDTDQVRKRLEKQIADFQDERAGLDQTITDAETQRQFLISLANKPFAPTGPEADVKVLDPAALGGLMDVMGTRLTSLAKVTQDAKLRQKYIDARCEELQNQVETLAPQGEYRTQVTVHLAAASVTKTAFRISYRINDAGWQPYYDAKLAVQKDGAVAKMELVQRAEVIQSTTENWDNVALTLSTARPAGATNAPDVFEQELVAAATDYELRQKSISGRVASDALSKDAAKVAEAPSPVTEEPKARENFAASQRQAFIESVGFQANYVVQGRVSIENSGTSKRVRISSDDIDTKLSVISAPRLDPGAYLIAEFAAKGEGPLLPGSVNLYRDGMYVGQGALPLLAVGEDAKLGFGVDDLVKVERKEIKRRTGEEGIISSSHVEERAWDITVKNLHGFAVPVTIMDRVPFAALDDIKIEMLPGTEPTEKDVEKKRGVLAWRFALEAGKDQVIKFGYKVSSPEAVQVGSVD